MIRVGPVAHEFWDDYRFFTVFRIEGDLAVIKGFDHPDISREEYESIVRCINAVEPELRVAYDRAGSPPIRMIQTDPGETKGKIVMSKEPLHKVAAAVTLSGINKTEFLAGARHALTQYEQGHIDFTNAGETPFSPGHTLIWAVRKD